MIGLGSDNNSQDSRSSQVFPVEGWNTPKYSLNRWPSLEVHHRAIIFRFLTTNWFLCCSQLLCLHYNHYHPPHLKWTLCGTFSEESNTDLCIWRFHQCNALQWINLYHFSHDYTISNCNGDWRDSRSTNKLKSHALFGQKKSVVNFNVVSGHRGLGTP